MAERRSRVMIVADACWEDPDGSLQTGRARIVDKSVSGACVRIDKQIHVGAKLKIESRWDQFCGVAKYCRTERDHYLVGIQRETGADSVPKQTAKSLPNRDGLQHQETTLQEPRVPDAVDRELHEQIPPQRRMPDSVPIRDETPRRDNLTGDHLAGGQRLESTIAEISASAPQNQAIAEVAVEAPTPRVDRNKSARRRRQSSQYPGVRFQQWREAQAILLLKEREAQKERGSRPMEINWMGRRKQDADDAKENGNASSAGAGERNKPIGAGSADTVEKHKAAAPVPAAQPVKERPAAAVDGDLPPQSELLPLDEIYVAAGIVSPRKGYTIKKVMQMLHSEHLTALSKEMRRASVMMALDAAGVSVDEVLRDAQARLDTIKAYEDDQKQLCEAQWARKAEEHARLKAELEQIRARFMDRMQHTLDGIARDRTRFGTWLTTMHEEAQSIADAAELCLKAAPPAPSPATSPVPSPVPDNVAVKTNEANETTLKVV